MAFPVNENGLVKSGPGILERGLKNTGCRMNRKKRNPNKTVKTTVKSISKFKSKRIHALAPLDLILLLSSK